MVVVAQLAEHPAVVRAVTGSSPVDHPRKKQGIVFLLVPSP